jgi:hypothetical protein
MGTIPGPIITFRFDQPQLTASIQPAFQQMRDQAKTVSNQIADDWKRMAAQIRASVAQGAMSTAQEADARKNIVSILQRELTLHSDLSNASNKQLANYKAMTLELERQSSFLKGTGGLTAGTSNALGQVSQQTILGIGRVLDSLVNRYFGGAAGAAFRTARDVQYYSSQAGGGTGAGILGGLTSDIPGGVLAVGGLTVGLTALAAAALAVTHNMAETAHSINSVAAETGLNTTQVQQYNELAKEMNLDASSLVNSFARLDSQLGKYLVTGKGADEGTQQFVKVAKMLGVSLEDSAKNIRPVNDIVGDFADKLQTIPNAGIRAEIATDAFGIRAKVLAEAMNLAAAEGKSLRDVLTTIGGSDLIIPEGQVQDLDRARTKWEELSRAVRGYVTDVKEGIAGGVLGAADFFSGVGNLPQTIGGQLNNLRYFGFATSGAGTAATGPGSGPSALSAYQSKQTANDLLVKRAELIKAGSKAEFELLQAEKSYSEAVKTSSGADAVKYANQITSLKAVLDLEKQRAEVWKRIQESLGRPQGASTASGREARSVQELMNNLLNPGQGGAPEIPASGNIRDVLSGVLGPQAKPGVNGFDILSQINKEHEDLFKSQASIDAEHYQDELDSLNEALKKQLISQQEYNAAAIKLAQDRNKTLNDADKKYEDEAGSLFEDLISGKTKSFSEALLKDVENIALGPVKKIFEQLVGSQLQALSDLFSGKKPGSGGAGGIWGTITGKIGGVIGPGGTPGWWPGAIGGGAGGGVGGGPGQTAVGTMNVAAQVVYLTTLGVAQTGGPGGGLGNFFGANSLLGGFGNFFGNLNPFGGSGSSGGGAAGASSSVSLLSKVFSQASPFAAGAAALGLGLATGNESTIAIGAATLAGKAATALSGLSGIPAGLGSALGAFGAAAPGLGIAASGIINAGQARTTAGKIGGVFESGAGGALAGAAIGSIIPGIGTAIGALIGGLFGAGGGGLAAIFGGGPQGFQQSVTYAMAHNQYHAPTSENFSFASNGSIASTLGTGFQQNGSRFSQYALPSNTSFAASALTGDLTWQQLYQLQNSGLNPNAPFLGNPSTNPYVGQGPVGVHATSSPNVNVTVAIPGLVDANQIASTLAPHITSIAQMVSKQVTNSSSGFASNVRRAAFPP